MGFSRQEYWSGLPYPPPGTLPDPGIEPQSPALQADSLQLRHQRSPIHIYVYIYGEREEENNGTNAVNCSNLVSLNKCYTEISVASVSLENPNTECRQKTILVITLGGTNRL